jgi:hypothetical protein
VGLSVKGSPKNDVDRLFAGPPGEVGHKSPDPWRNAYRGLWFGGLSLKSPVENWPRLAEVLKSFSIFTALCCISRKGNQVCDIASRR